MLKIENFKRNYLLTTVINEKDKDFERMKKNCLFHYNFKLVEKSKEFYLSFYDGVASVLVKETELLKVDNKFIECEKYEIKLYLEVIFKEEYLND